MSWRFVIVLLFPVVLSAQKPQLIVPTGHSAPIEIVELSPDGRYLVSYDRDEVLNLWQVERGANLLTIDERSLREIRFSSDSRFLLLMDLNYALRVIDIFSLKETFTIDPGIEARTPIPNRKEVNPDTIRNLSKLNQLDTQIIEKGMWLYEPAEIDQDGNIIKEAREIPPPMDTTYWIPDTLYMLNHSIDYNKRIFGASVLANHTLIALQGDSVKSYDVKTGKHQFSWYCPERKWLSPDARYCLTLGERWEIRDPNSGKLIDSLAAKVVGAYEFVEPHFTNDAPIVAFKYYDSLQVWNLETTKLEYQTSLQSIQFEGISADGKTLIFESFGEQVKEVRGGDMIIAIQYGAGKLKLFDWERKDTIAKIPIGKAGVLTAKMNNDHTQLIAGMYDARLTSWSVSNKQREQFFGNTNFHAVRKAEFSPDDQSIVTLLANGQKDKWNLANSTLSTHQIGEAGYGAFDTVFIGDDSTETLKIEWPLTYYQFQWMRFPTEEVFITRPGEGLAGRTQFGVISHNAEIHSVKFSNAGTHLISASQDKTCKIYKAIPKQDGVNWEIKHLATLIHENADNWIVTTPDGLFDASPSAMQTLYYVVPYQQEWIVVELEQLKARYYEPGLLPKLMDFSEERLRPVEEFESLKIYPKVDAEIQKNQLNIQLQSRNGGIGKVSIFINGKEVVEEANPLPRRENARRDSIINFDLLQHQNYLFRHPDSTNVISIRAYNEEGWLKSQAIELDYKIARAQSKGSYEQRTGDAWQGQLDPKLYVISVGTSDYTGTQLDLRYADQDATMMAKALESVGTALFTNGDSLEVHCLTTAVADSTGLEGSKISWLFADRTNIAAVFKDLKSKAKAEDVLVVYFSGHGVTQSGNDQTQFYYLTQGVASEDDLDDPATLKAYTISSEELTKWINDIPALKQVLIIDACNSGQIVENLTGATKTMNSSQVRALDRMKDRTGMFVLSGSASNKVSYEASEYGQGLLTYALLQGMLGLATRKDGAGKETVDVMKLFQYARDEVPRLAESVNGIQTPMLGFPNQGASFDIGILDEISKEKIELANKKPVLVKSIFLNKKTFQDDLKLAELLEVSLRKESEKGSEADLIYVDVYEYPGSYSVSGLYKIEGEDIILELKFFKDRKDPVDLKVPVEKDPNRLIKRIKRAIRDQLMKQ